ncbi:hypothetical protein Nmel_017622, partial [Mimus melanotis]
NTTGKFSQTFKKKKKKKKGLNQRDSSITNRGKQKDALNPQRSPSLLRPGSFSNAANPPGLSGCTFAAASSAGGRRMPFHSLPHLGTTWQPQNSQNCVHEGFLKLGTECVKSS